MRIVTALGVRQHLGELLDAASAGERILIERDRRPMAVLVSVEDAQRLDEDPQDALRRKLAALDRLAAMGERWAREHPRDPDLPDIATQVRQDREDRAEQIERAIRGGRDG